MRPLLLLGFVCGLAFNAWAQDSLPTTPKWRKPFVWSATGASFAGSLVVLDQLWFADYPRSNFHFFNDLNQWGGMDKTGHALSAYLIGENLYRINRWAGMKPKAALWTGSLTGWTYQAVIEVLDGFSSAWGFSPGDIAANSLGTGLLLSQELLWQEQRIRLKYSYWPSEYAPLRPNLLGSSFAESWLKDYNGQRYWLSVNPSSFARKESQSRFPQWLNFAFGHSIRGYTGGSANPYLTGHLERRQQLFLSLDIDWTRIRTKKAWLRTLFHALNYIKVPAPTLEWQSGSGQNLRFHWLFF